MTRDQSETLKDMLWDEAQKHDDATRRGGITLAADYDGQHAVLDTCESCYTLAQVGAAIDALELEASDGR